MQRPVFIATLGFIIGIIWGLYFNIVLFIFLILGLYYILYIAKMKQIRILKLFITKKVLILFCLCFLCANCYIKYLENDYNKIYNSLDRVQCVGTIIGDRIENNYTHKYIVKLEKINNKKIKDKRMYLTISKTKDSIKFGQKVTFYGDYIRAEVQRNYKGFDYSKFLKSQGIYGTIKVNGKVQVLKGKNVNFFLYVSNKIRNKIINNINKVFPNETKGVFLGILIGYDEFIEENIKDNFARSSLSHILAVSGAHVSYVLLGISFFLKLFKMPKKIQKIIICFLLIFYLFIINFTPSVTRAIIMSIILILQLVLNRKQDTATTISFSSLIILISNPYKILNIGFLLSYAGTIGILVWVKKFQEEPKNLKEKIIFFVKNIIYVTLSAQILILPIMTYCFNIISLTFIFSNLISGIIIGPVILIGLILISFSFFNIKLLTIIVIPYNFLLLILIKSTEIIAKIPISSVYVKTPNIFLIILYYIVVFNFFIFIIIRRSKRVYLNKKLNCLILKIKKKLVTNVLNIFSIILIIIIIFIVYNKIPKKLIINFIDVGQGDSCFITTPKGKKILIDSGGSESYDVGKNVLLPYLLDRGVTKIDYIIISHFDTDHYKGFEIVMKNLKVKNAIISKQAENSENYEEFIKIAQKNKINIIIVNKGDKLNIEKNLYINILWPNNSTLLNENALNNNSIVCKLNYRNFSCLFTGDIEKIAEEQMVKDYEKSKILESTILKVAHHGSKTSTTQELLKMIKPKIALIGVGKNNKFGHPNNETLEKLEKIRS